MLGSSNQAYLCTVGIWDRRLCGFSCSRSLWDSSDPMWVLWVDLRGRYIFSGWLAGYILAMYVHFIPCWSKTSKSLQHHENSYWLWIDPIKWEVGRLQRKLVEEPGIIPYCCPPGIVHSFYWASAVGIPEMSFACYFKYEHVGHDLYKSVFWFVLFLDMYKFTILELHWSMEEAEEALTWDSCFELYLHLNSSG